MSNILKKSDDEDDEQAVLQHSVFGLRDRLLGELSRMDTGEEFETATSEQRLKYLTGFFKTLQGVEEMINRLREASERQKDTGIDVVEFRRQLEKQIAKLVNEEAEGALS